MKKTIRTILIIIFSLYCLALCYFSFFKSVPANGLWIDHIKKSVNFIPFRSICDYIKRFADGKVNQTTFLINIFGNIAAFVPMGFFIPNIFRKINTFAKSILVCLSIVVCVEIIQLVTMVGSFDIDDIILKLSGCILGYGLYRIKPIYNFFQKYN